MASLRTSPTPPPLHSGRRPQTLAPRRPARLPTLSLALTLALALASTTATAQSFFEVAQESGPSVGDFDCNILGTIPIWDASAQSAAQLYNYGGTNSVSCGTPFPYQFAVDRSHLIIARTTDGLTLQVVHDVPNVANSGGAAAMKTDIISSATPVRRTVEDDTTASDASDIYTGPPGAASFTASQDWGGQNTDGFSLSGFSGPWELHVQFTAAPTSITSWAVISKEGSYVPLELVPGRRVRLRPATTNPGTLAALYRFDNSSAADSSGWNRDAYSDPAAPATAGFSSSGFEGNGSLALTTSSWVLTDLDIGPTRFPQLTMGAWVRLPSVTTSPVLLHSSAGVTGVRSIFMDSVGGIIGWRTNNNTSTLAAVAGRWQFVAAAFDAATQQVRVNVDGVETTGTGSPPDANTRLAIGRNRRLDNGSFNGEVDNVFIISEFLSTARLNEIRLGGYRRIPTCAKFFQHPACVTACPGGDAVFSVDAGGSLLGGVPLTFRWETSSPAAPDTWTTLANGVDPQLGAVSGAAGATLTIRSLNLLASGRHFRCVATNACGATASNHATLSFCIADFDNGSGEGRCDGAVTLEDLLYYLGAYESGSPRADIDNGSGGGTPDGAVTIEDLLYYLQRYDVGC